MKRFLGIVIVLALAGCGELVGPEANCQDEVRSLEVHNVAGLLPDSIKVLEVNYQMCVERFTYRLPHTTH